MSIRYLAGVAFAASLALVTLPAAAKAQSASHGDCVRQAGPSSSAPHDVFRRILCVHRGEVASGNVRASRTALAMRPCRIGSQAMPACVAGAQHGMM